MFTLAYINKLDVPWIAFKIMIDHNKVDELTLILNKFYMCYF